MSVELQGGLNDIFLVNFVLPRIYALGVFHLYVIDAKQIRKLGAYDVFRRGNMVILHFYLINWRWS